MTFIRHFVRNFLFLSKISIDLLAIKLTVHFRTERNANLYYWSWNFHCKENLFTDDSSKKKLINGIEYLIVRWCVLLSYPVMQKNLKET